MIKSIKYQLMYFLKEQYSKTLTEVTYTKNSDGLSGMDKMEMNLQKIDEGLIILAEQNVKIELERIKRDNDIGITDDEINFYMKYHQPSLLQVQLVFSYWGKHFGPYRNTANISKRDYIILLLVLRNRLLLNAGLDNAKDVQEKVKLPFLLTGNKLDKINTRIIRNNKFISKVDESYLYEKIRTEKYSNLCMIRPDYILSILSQAINTTFTYVTYEHPELMGTPIEYNEDKISDELLFFINSI